MSLRQGITKGAQIEITYYCEFNFVHLHKILPKPSPITNIGGLTNRRWLKFLPLLQINK